MAASKRMIVPLVALAALAPASAPAAPPSVRGAKAQPGARALLVSKELWATIDVCNPKDQPDTVGIRGSMPGDGQARDRMYMSFRLQYLERNTMRWLDLSTGASTGFVSVGAGAAASRQDGGSFVIAPVAGRPAFTLRGVVDFQWRRGRKVLVSGERPTTVGRLSVSGADPAGYSAATCLIG